AHSAAGDGTELVTGVQPVAGPGHDTTARIVSGPPQAESSARPLERRAFRMARPARVRMRARKPCFLALRRLFGWNVRLLMVLLDRGHGRAPRGGLWSAARTGSPGAPAGTGRLPRSDPMPEGVLSGSGNRIGTARSADCTILGTGVHGVNASALQRPGCGRILTRLPLVEVSCRASHGASHAGRPGEEDLITCCPHPRSTIQELLWKTVPTARSISRE